MTGSGLGVYMAYGTRESSSGGPFFRDIEQQGTSASVEVYNYMWSGHNDTEAQRLGVLHGPYAPHGWRARPRPAAPDMSFMASLGPPQARSPRPGAATWSGPCPGSQAGLAAHGRLGELRPPVWAVPSRRTATSPAR